MIMEYVSLLLRTSIESPMESSVVFDIFSCASAWAARQMCLSMHCLSVQMNVCDQYHYYFHQQQYAREIIWSDAHATRIPGRIRYMSTLSKGKALPEALRSINHVHGCFKGTLRCITIFGVNRIDPEALDSTPARRPVC